MGKSPPQPIPAAPRPLPMCGLVMPISDTDGYPKGHWTEVKQILSEAIADADFNPCLVSDTDEVTTIHRTIIQRLYQDAVIVCDVSSRNPNVMIELGIRLTFDKPTVIVKDHETPYSFDTSVIEHLLYPRDLRFQGIIAFKKKLKEKIVATHKKANEDQDFSQFLKQFGPFQVPKIETKEVSANDYLLREMQDLKNLILHRVMRPQPELSPLRLDVLMENTISKVIDDVRSEGMNMDDPNAEQAIRQLVMERMLMIRPDLAPTSKLEKDIAHAVSLSLI